MSLGQTFRLSLYGTVLFAGVILGRAEGRYLVPYLTIFVAALGWYLTEPPRSRGAPGWLSNLFGLLSVLASSVEFFSENPEGRLLAGSHLIVYITWIVLLQAKGTRQYWTLLGLSILQVAVASVLTNGGWFGLSLIGFNTLAMWTLAVFSLFEADQQFGQAVVRTGSHEAVLVGPSRLLTASWTGERWYDRPSDSRSTMHYDVQRRWLTARFAGGVFSLSAMSLLIGAMFFLLIPRMWIGQPLTIGEGRDGALGRRALTGFTPQVRLGEMGQILESAAPVLSLRLYDAVSDNPVDIADYTARQGGDEPLFRGSVLSNYSSGRWEMEPSGRQGHKRPSSWNLPGLRQEIMLEPIGTNVLFCLGEAVAVRIRNSQEAGFWSPSTGLTQPEGNSLQRRGRLSYTVFSRWPDADPEGSSPQTVIDRQRWWDQQADMYFRRLLQLPRIGLDRLVDLSRQVADTAQQKQKGRDLSNLELARALESHLRDSGIYSYSLNLSVDDSDIDPVEDFLFNRKQGNCEYFASALALMLRSQGIPSRLVTGFKGGEINPLSGSFEVQQRHAHAWVEASVDGQRWITLDPTPAVARTASVNSMSPSVSVWGWVKTLGSGFWDDYVVSVSLERQQELIYQPLRALTLQMALQIKNYFGNLLSWFGVDREFLSDPRNWFSLTGGVITAVVLLLISAAAWLVGWGWNQLRAWWQPKAAAATGRHKFVAFYDRFCRLLAAAGQVRKPADTPEEFAVVVSRQLQPTLSTAGLQNFPMELTRRFYQTRFGGAEPTPEEISSLEQQLNRLETALAPRPVTR